MSYPNPDPGSEGSFGQEPAGPYETTGQAYAGPTGPYGQPVPYGGPAGSYGTGPAGPYGPGGPAYGGPGGPPPRKSHAGLIAGLVGGGVLIVVLVVVGAFVLFSGGGSGNGLDDLPAPKALGHDPVPAEKSITARPADCGVTKATIKALTPGADQDGIGGNCSWSDYTSADARDLDVEYKTDVPAPETTSKVAAAIGAFQEETSDRTAPTGSMYKPMTGLGDDAAYRVGPDAAGNGIEAVVVFRAADLVTEVTYKSLEGKLSAATSKKFRNGAFTAAADVAKALGVTANPAVAHATQGAPVALPNDVCGLIPKDLLKTLGGEADPLTHPDSDDEIVDKDSIPAATTVGCRMSAFGNGGDRTMEVHVTGATKPGTDAAVAREYLAAYYEARAEKPGSGGGGRYFQALSGLGDQAFCSYLDGTRGDSILGKDTAEIVIRKRTALISVSFGGELSDSKLTQKQTINGAYAVAQKVAAGVK